MGETGFPTLEDILHLRQNINGAYTFYCKHFLRPIVSDKVWKCKSYVVVLSDETFVTATDESLGLLILENNWDFWSALANALPQGPKVEVANYPPRYTAEAKTAGKGKGWNEEGKDRFISLTSLIREDRAERKAFEAEFLKTMRDAGKAKRKTPPPPVATVTPRKVLPSDFPVFSDSEDEDDDSGPDSTGATLVEAV